VRVAAYVRVLTIPLFSGAADRAMPVCRHVTVRTSAESDSPVKMPSADRGCPMSGACSVARSLAKVGDAGSAFTFTEWFAWE